MTSASMIYSVWDPGTHRYTYYEVTERHADDVPTPRCRGGSKVGCAPGQISYTLPSGARRVGAGEHARGVVVHPGAGGALGGLEGSWAPVVLLGAAAVIGWKALK